MSDYFFTLTDLKSNFWSLIITAVLSPIITYLWGRTFGHRKVAVPLWLLIVFGSYTLFSLIGSFVVYRNKTKKLEVIRNQTFAYQTIELDGKAYINCTFKRCRLVFFGRREFSLLGNRFTEGGEVRLDDRAGLTLQAIAELRTMPTMKRQVDKMIDTLAEHDLGPGKVLYLGKDAHDTLDYSEH